MSSQEKTGGKVFTPRELFQEGSGIKIRTKDHLTFLLEVECVVGDFPDETWREAALVCHRVKGKKKVLEGIFVATTVGPGSDHNLEVGKPYYLEPRGHDGGEFTLLNLGEIASVSIFKTDRSMRPLITIPLRTP